jgi:5-methylthioadenosine/S-adenosylhomocysteine deaminase
VTADAILTTGGHVITMDPDSGDFSSGDVVVVHGQIDSAGDGLRAPARGRLLDASGQLVLPGLSILIGTQGWALHSPALATSA